MKALDFCKKWAKSRIFIGACAATLLVIVLLVASGKDNANTDNLVVTSNEAALWTIAQQSRAQYVELREKHIALQLKYALLESAYETTKLNADSVNELLQGSANAAGRIIVLEGQLAELKEEMDNIRVLLRITIDERATFEKNFIRSQYEKTEIAGALEVLLTRIDEFTGYIAATSNLTSDNVTSLWGKTMRAVKE